MSSAFPPLAPEYDAFLYAVICDEAHGVELTVASAIARSGADPWTQAAEISKMRKDRAIEALTRLVVNQTGDAAPQANSAQATAERLFLLLPQRKYGPIAHAIGFLRGKGATAVLVLVFSTAVLVAYLCATPLLFDTNDLASGPPASPPVEVIL